MLTWTEGKEQSRGQLPVWRATLGAHLHEFIFKLTLVYVDVCEPGLSRGTYVRRHHLTLVAAIGGIR